MQDLSGIPETRDASSDPEDLGLPQESFKTIHFRVPVFEGPLDLLLHLIKTNKIDIYDIPIVDITRQYLEYLDFMKEMNLEIAGDFLVMAATLIHIKSRTLLPVDEDESDESTEDPRTELVERLLEYKRFQDVSGLLRVREDVWKNVFHRSLTEGYEFDHEPEPELVEVSVFDLITAFKSLLTRAPEQIIEITRETLTVTDRINYIMERLDRESGIRFLDLFSEGYSKVMLIVTFLALLELNRLGLARAYQEQAFGIIWIVNPHRDDSLHIREESSEKAQESA